MLERAHIERFRVLIAERFGLQYDDDKLEFLADVLRQRVLASRSPSADAYLQRFSTSPRASDEQRALAEALTVNETFFFRNADNFRALAEHVIPACVYGKGHDRRLHILSAGCASGEEPYSIAIMARESMPDADRCDVHITAIDMSPPMLAKAAAARYSPWSLRATPESIQRRYFNKDGRDFVLDAKIRDTVQFEERNIAVDDHLFWRPEVFDVVFCRNVIMYFTADAMSAVVRRIAQALRPGGFLFLGHAETLRGLSQDFHLCHTHDTFYYQRRDETSASVIAARPSRSLALPALPSVVDSSTSWIEAIQSASERIAQLAHRQTPVADAVAAVPIVESPATRSWDLSLVLEAMRQERFAEAFELLTALPAESQSDPDALLLRAVLLTNAGRLHDAEDACAQLFVLDELNAGAHYVMALCREHGGDATAAIEHDQTAVYLDASFAMPHLHLGLLSRRAGDAATAVRELSQALVLLAREDVSRLLLFGGGFSRDTLLLLCRTELRAAEGEQ